MDSRSIECALRSAWGSEFIGLPAWPVHADGIPRSDEELVDVLYAAPTEALEFVASQREPGARMPPLALPADRARLLDPGGAFAVLRAGNVAYWSAPVADLCRCF